MRRRTLLKTAVFGTVAVATGASAWLAFGPTPPVAGLADFAALQRALEEWLRRPPPEPAGQWPAARMLAHAAQSIEMSMDGYPQLRAGWFRASVGPLAFRVFERRGQMSHSLVEPIPGAPVLDAVALEPAALRLQAAVARFEAHRGALAPHFAYGALDHAQYTRAHLLHLADHWRVYPA